MKVKMEVGGSRKKMVSFTSYHYDHEMFCFNREMSTSKAFIDSKAWFPLSFLPELLSPNGYTKQKHEK